MVHELPINSELCSVVLNGEKTFDVRMNDREFQKGDRIRYMAIRTPNKEIEKRLYEVTYVLSGVGIEKDYVVFGIKEI